MSVSTVDDTIPPIIGTAMLHDLRTRSGTPHDRQQPGHDGRDRHDLRPHALDRALHDRSFQVVARKRALLRIDEAAALFERMVEIDEHDHARLGGHPG